MARYDRIAPIDAPPRESVFPAWLVLRDLEGRDRDTDLARRARLRYLAIRPVRRLLDRGTNAVGSASYLAEIEVAREDLGYLPARDAERARLARFLHQIEQRDLASIIVALLEVADSCVAAGHVHGAEEYAITAHGLAAAAAEYRLQGVANTTRARIHRERAQFEEAAQCAQKAEAIALRIGNRADLVRVRAEASLAQAAQGDAQAARDTLEQTLAQITNAHDAQLEALAEARLCATEIALSNPGGALEHGGRALRNLEDPRERIMLLENVGVAFAATGLHKVAERCYAIVAQRAADPAVRARARAARAAQSAAAGNASSFRDQRSAVLSDSAEWSADPRATCFVHLELGRGCTIVQDFDFARDHLRSAIAVARKHSLADVLASAENILSALETNNPDALLGPKGDAPGLAVARSIAEQLESLPDFSPMLA